jgi:hypothetical protein
MHGPCWHSKDGAVGRRILAGTVLGARAKVRLGVCECEWAGGRDTMHLGEVGEWVSVRDVIEGGGAALQKKRGCKAG